MKGGDIDVYLFGLTVLQLTRNSERRFTIDMSIAIRIVILVSGNKKMIFNEITLTGANNFISCNHNDEKSVTLVYV